MYSLRASRMIARSVRGRRRRAGSRGRGAPARATRHTDLLRVQVHVLHVKYTHLLLRKDASMTASQRALGS
jgi:hypothetical protein